MALERILGPLAVVAACGLAYLSHYHVHHRADMRALDHEEEEEWSTGNEQPEEADRGAFDTEMVNRRSQDAEPSAAQFVVGRHVQMQNQILAMLNLIDWDIFRTHGHSNALEQSRSSEHSFSNELANHVTWCAARIIKPVMLAADTAELWGAMQTFLEAITNGDRLQQVRSGAGVVDLVIQLLPHYFPQQTNADESAGAFFGHAARIIHRAGKILQSPICVCVITVYHCARQILRLLNELAILDLRLLNTILNELAILDERLENAGLRQELEITEQALEAAELQLSDADERCRGLETKLTLYESKHQQLIADKQVQHEIIQQLLSRRRACTGRRNMANTLP